MLTVTDVRHFWAEPAGFRLKRDLGRPDYAFVHFITEVDLTLDGVTRSLPPHACIVYSPGTPQHFVSHTPLIHDWFHFVGDPPLSLPLDTVFYPQQTDFVTLLVREIENEFFAQRADCDILLDMKINELFLKLRRELQQAQSERRVFVDRSMLEKLWRLRQEAFHSLGRSWSVAEMAARVGLSPSRFHEVYRSAYGCSPMGDVIRARIDAAKHLLLFTSQSIASIAETLGYNNETHFIRQFRQLTGCSPSRYRSEGEGFTNDHSIQGGNTHV